MNYTNISVV